MKHLACTLTLGLLVACGAEKSGEDSGTGAAGTSTTGASTDAPTSTTGAGSSSGAPTTTSSTGAPDLTSTGDASCGTACTGTSEDGGSFLTGEPDAGDKLGCDVLAEDCPAGQKCMPYVDGGDALWNALKCVPVDPSPVGVGEACDAPGNGLTGIDNCDKHVMCWDVENDVGVCAAMCVDNGCAAGFNCFVANDGILNLCLQACDVDMPDCPPGTGCLPVLAGGVCAPA